MLFDPTLCDLGGRLIGFRLLRVCVRCKSKRAWKENGTLGGLCGKVTLGGLCGNVTWTGLKEWHRRKGIPFYYCLGIYHKPIMTAGLAIIIILWYCYYYFTPPYRVRFRFDLDRPYQVRFPKPALPHLSKFFVYIITEWIGVLECWGGELPTHAAITEYFHALPTTRKNPISIIIHAFDS